MLVNLALYLKWPSGDSQKRRALVNDQHSEENIKNEELVDQSCVRQRNTLLLSNAHNSRNKSRTIIWRSIFNEKIKSELNRVWLKSKIVHLSGCEWNSLLGAQIKVVAYVWIACVKQKCFVLVLWFSIDANDCKNTMWANLVKRSARNGFPSGQKKSKRNGVGAAPNYSQSSAKRHCFVSD